MEKSIMVVIGVVIAMACAAIILRMVQTNIGEAPEQGRFLDIQNSSYRDRLELAWETDVATDGAVRYTVHGKNMTVHDTVFKQSHNVLIELLDGEVIYAIHACDIAGKCFSSPEMRATFLLQTCSDGTPYERCSENKPSYCNLGTLADDCLRCGCPLGQFCETSGACSTV